MQPVICDAEPGGRAYPGPAMARAKPIGEPRRHLVLYIFAAVSYIVVGMLEKSLLNWVLGPLWLVVVLALGLRLLSGRRR